MILKFKNRIACLTLGLSLLVMGADAQKLAKYEDVLPGILVSNPATAIASLKEYRLADSENPSIQVQLGLFYYDRFAVSDPLVQYKKSMANIELAQEAYSSAKTLLSEKEVRKSKAEYINFAVYDDRGKYEVSYDSVLQKIKQDSLHMSQFAEHVPAIYEDFTKSYGEYSKANQLFTQVIGEYKTIKSLYLLHDATLMAKLEEIKSSYLSAMEYFESYKSKLASYDIGYHQELNIRDISVYRLDGLSVEINFLQDQIPIWDYAKWVDETNAYVESEISYLRELMVQNEKLLNLKLSKTKDDYLSHDFELLTVSKELLFNIRKYDLKSVVEPLFQYKQHEQQLTYMDLMQQHNATTEQMDIERKMSNYGRLLYRLQSADTVLNTIKIRNTDESYQKYRGFIDEYYKGQTGVNMYVKEKKGHNQQQFSSYLTSLEKLSRKKCADDSLKKVLKYGKWTIRDYAEILTDELLQSGAAITTTVIKNLDNSEYLGGVQRDNKSGRMTTFICRRDGNGKVTWLKEINLGIEGSDAATDNQLAAMNDAQSGCALVVSTTNPVTGDTMNTLLTYDDQGKQVMGTKLDTEVYPRTVNYVEKLNAYVLSFYGDNYQFNLSSGTELIVSQVDAYGEKKWESQRKLSGDLYGLIVTEDGFVLSGNYTTVTAQDGNVQKLSAGKTATYLLKINKTGEWVEERFFDESQSYLTNIIFKSGDNCINIYGSTNLTPNASGLESDPSKLVHYIVSKDLSIVSSSFAR